MQVDAQGMDLRIIESAGDLLPNVPREVSLRSSLWPVPQISRPRELTRPALCQLPLTTSCAMLKASWNFQLHLVVLLVASTPPWGTQEKVLVGDHRPSH